MALHYWNVSTPEDPHPVAEALAVVAKAAEEAGFAELSVMDHYFEQRAGADEASIAERALCESR